MKIIMRDGPRSRANKAKRKSARSIPKPITITKEYTVTCCYNCPYFKDNRHAPACTNPDLPYCSIFKVFESRAQIEQRRPDACPLDGHPPG